MTAILKPTDVELVEAKEWTARKGAVLSISPETASEVDGLCFVSINSFYDLQSLGFIPAHLNMASVVSAIQQDELEVQSAAPAEEADCGCKKSAAASGKSYRNLATAIAPVGVQPLPSNSPFLAGIAKIVMGEHQPVLRTLVANTISVQDNATLDVSNIDCLLVDTLKVAPSSVLNLRGISFLRVNTSTIA